MMRGGGGGGNYSREAIDQGTAIIRGIYSILQMLILPVLVPANLKCIALCPLVVSKMKKGFHLLFQHYFCGLLLFDQILLSFVEILVEGKWGCCSAHCKNALDKNDFQHHPG